MFALFPFVAPGHPFFAQVERLRGLIAAHPGLAALAAGRTTVHAEIKAVAGAAGWSFDRFYWSLQSRDDTRLRALTLSYAAKSGDTRWYEFPDDSYLNTMAAFFAAAPDPVRVLRYVPLRRLTFRAAGADGVPLIGKFKRASRFRQAYQLLGVVADAVAAAPPGFGVSRPLGMDEARCLYYQSALPGVDLAEQVSADNCRHLLAAVGALHRSLHEVPVAAAPLAPPHAALDTVRRDVAWIGFMQPALAPWLGDILALLERTAPALPAQEAVFCHGDFVCSQILMADGGWSVTDFDLCHRGDPCRDMAILLASLPYDVPLLRQAAARGSDADRALLAAAAEAYRAGYARRAGREVDALRLTWQRIAAEIYYLGLMLKKDQFSASIAQHRLGLIRSLAADLAQGTANAP